MSTDAVVIWGELLWDRYPAGPGGDQLGGAPANVAWHIAQAGGWAQLVTRVGDDDDGYRAIALLDGLVDTSLIQIDPDRATGEVTIQIEHGEPRYTLHPGRAWERIDCTAAVTDAIHEAGVFVYGTLAQRTAEGLAAWQRAIEAARTRALKVYDANLRPNDQASHVIGTALEHADLIKLNDREVAQLRGLFGWRDPVAELRAERPRIIVITHGAAGSTIYPLDAAPIEIPGVPAATGGDNVGCGDAYLALFLFGMTSGWDLEVSGRVASRWAAAVAGVRGATPLFEAERIAELLEPA
ncbi:MAG TPA: PfkB family carbohydrate kinase [Kofleriaceae bacterium]|jgi:fructokinase|nr:PfkB family carbohydrate kinase [Kofleriaceae bacterium]